MPYPFAEIAFTPAVRAAQTANGSREFCEAMEKSDRDFVFSEREAEFLAARDHFFMATVTETGWPYLQHRGGPAGFIQVLSDKRFAFPDFRGNRQYVSVGNLSVDARAAFFFIDYPNRARLKALARVTAKSVDDEPEVIKRFSAFNYKAKIERVFIAEVEALDWNCPQHITPRFTDADLAPAISKLTNEIDALRAENEALKERLALA
ncbi:MAG: pyridoxamine 5'-phosphate oxidase family protein [Parvularculaceae bacterium]